MSIRNNISMRIVVVWLVVLAVAFSGCAIIKKDPEALKNAAVAKVNGEIITRQEFMENFELYKRSYESQYGKDIWNEDIEGKKFIDVVKEQVLEKMILDKLILEEAAKLGIEVSEEEVNKEVEHIKEYFESDEKFKEFLASQNITEERFKEQVKKDLIIFKYKEKVVEDVKVSEEDIREYYDNNIKEFKNDQVRASHILLDTREEAEMVLQKIKNGEDFNKLAEEYSVDPSVKSNKGDLGYFGYGEMVKPFEEAAFALEAGEVSDIVKTQFGYHIIKVHDKKIVEPTPFHEVKEDIKNMLLYNARETKYNQVVKELREKAEVEIYTKNMQ